MPKPERSEVISKVKSQFQSLSAGTEIYCASGVALWVFKADLKLNKMIKNCLIIQDMKEMIAKIICESVTEMFLKLYDSTLYS